MDDALLVVRVIFDVEDYLGEIKVQNLEDEKISLLSCIPLVIDKILLIVFVSLCLINSPNKSSSYSTWQPFQDLTRFKQSLANT